MFRAAGDNSVTTPAACHPTHSNLRIPKCPPAARFAPNQTRHVEGHDLRRPHSTPTNHPYASGFPPKPWRVPLCCLRLDGSDLLVLDRRQQPGGAMATAGVVEVVAPGRHDLSCLGLGGEPMPGQHLVFEGAEERLRGGVVEAHDPTRPIDCRI